MFSARVLLSACSLRQCLFVAALVFRGVCYLKFANVKRIQWNRNYYLIKIVTLHQLNKQIRQLKPYIRIHAAHPAYKMYSYFRDFAGHGNAYPSVRKSSLFEGQATMRRMRIDVMLIRWRAASQHTKCYAQARRTVD
jgi:hypothetical protein